MITQEAILLIIVIIMTNVVAFGIIIIISINKNIDFKIGVFYISLVCILTTILLTQSIYYSEKLKYDNLLYKLILTPVEEEYVILHNNEEIEVNKMILQYLRIEEYETVSDEKMRIISFIYKNAIEKILNE